MQSQILNIIRQRNTATSIDIMRELKIDTEDWIKQDIEKHIRKLLQESKIISYKIGQTTVYRYCK